MIFFRERLVNCTTNIIVNVNESVELTCSIEYEFLNYDDLDIYQPMINLTFYIRENEFTYKMIDQTYLSEIKDFKIGHNKTLNWKRSIIYRIKEINTEHNQEYGCIALSDRLRNEDLFNDNDRICRIHVHVKSNALLINIIIRSYLSSFLSLDNNSSNIAFSKLS